MKRIIITGQWVDTLPLPHTRPYVLDIIFKAAAERGWTVETMRKWNQ